MTVALRSGRPFWISPLRTVLLPAVAALIGAGLFTASAIAADLQPTASFSTNTSQSADSAAGPLAAQTPATASVLASVPPILSRVDAAHYAAAFALQEDGNWKAADRHIALVKDRVLTGTLLAQRYLSPAYHTTFAEARSWLVLYRDQPEAHALWVLARHRAPRRATLPKPMQAMAGVSLVGASDGESAVRLPDEPRSVTVKAPPRFQAGLAAWRLRHYGEAATDFEAVANAADVSGWYVAAAAFWAARAHLVTHEPEKVDTWLEFAAQQPRTFYGLLARRLLDMDSGVQFGPQPLSAREQAQLEVLPGGRRALALVQVGETDRAEAELRALSSHARPSLANAVVALADIAQMPSLCEALEPMVNDARRRIDAAYPMPRWKPREGYTVDRALMFALMMQESNFDANAESGSGAAGLMQLMPQTAKAVARRTGISFHGVDDLVDPELNLSLGQEYVHQLLAHQEVRGNLILMLAAYNSGTGPLDGWLNKPEYRRDPLLFIESLPHQETRLYVERVLANMWIYRQRLGQPVHDLDELASNKWPTYVSQDANATAVASASRNVDTP
jgi:soluble lytic murein transglycosylase